MVCGVRRNYESSGNGYRIFLSRLEKLRVDEEEVKTKGAGNPKTGTILLKRLLKTMNNKKEECKHKFVPLRQKSSHEGACYHVGSCLIDEFYCESCGGKNESQTIYKTTSTN